jgi:hypothetical protein
MKRAQGAQIEKDKRASPLQPGNHLRIQGLL